MPHRLRKVRKLRGSRQHGWGQISQHRGISHEGGRGMAGRRKHKWTYVVKYEPDYFGKNGFRYPRSKYIKTINVGELDAFSEKLPKKTKMKDGKVIIDLQELGYDKLLGSGAVKTSLAVKVSSFSKLAEEKIKGAGGKILKID